jgi:hypothetical protein
MTDWIEPPKLFNSQGSEIRYTPPISNSEQLLVAAFKCRVSYENLEAAKATIRNGGVTLSDAMGELINGNFIRYKRDYAPVFPGTRYGLRFIGPEGVWGIRGLLLLDSLEALDARIAEMSDRLQNDKIGLVAEQDSASHQYPVFDGEDSLRQYKEDYQKSFVSWFESEAFAVARATYEANIEKWGS